MKRRLTVLFSAVLLILAARPAIAATPMASLRDHVDRIVAVLQDPALEGRADARRREVRKIAEEIFDFADSARRSLGPHWQARTPAEQEEFVRLYSDLLERAYISKIEQYHGEPIKYVGETADGDEGTVRTDIVTKQGSEIPVNYRLHQQNGQWRVYDVIIEGVSLVANYRTQFNKIIRTTSYRDLVARLRAKAEPGA
jgi:phospholipid transport system substrate-binding protein